MTSRRLESPGGRWVLLTAASIAVLVAGCGLSGQDDASAIDPDDVPFGLLEATTTTLAVAELPEVVCGIGGDDPLFAPGDPDVVVDIERGDDGIAVIELTDELLDDVGRDDQLLAVAQLTCAVTLEPGVELVRFTRDGASIDVPRADGSLTSDPVEVADYVDVLAGESPD